MRILTWPSVCLFVCWFSVVEPAAGGEMLVGFKQVRIEGRTAVGTDGRIQMGFPGVTLHLRCRGDRLSLVAEASSDEVFFDVLVDGAAPVRLRLHSGRGSYPLLVAGTPPGEHTLEIVRRTESWQGTVDVLGIALEGGTVLMDPPAAQSRRLLFVGDSVTSGEIAAYAAEDPLNAKSTHNAHAANARLSYGYLLSRQLGAECSLVSYGGRGLTRDWEGIRTKATAPEFYERARPDDPHQLWNHSSYVPDAVGVCLGTNDFNSGIPDETEFVGAYVEFLRKIRRDAPQAWIFLLESPILDDAPGRPPKRTILRSYLDAVIAHLGDSRVILGPVRHYAGLPGNGHPLARDHAQMADELRPLFQRALGW